jgi:hypothetical protein
MREAQKWKKPEPEIAEDFLKPERPNRIQCATLSDERFTSWIIDVIPGTALEESSHEAGAQYPVCQFKNYRVRAASLQL